MREDGSKFYTFVKLGVAHFEGIYREEDIVNVEEVVMMTSIFHVFMEEEDNEKLLKTISKEEL